MFRKEKKQIFIQNNKEKKFTKLLEQFKNPIGKS
jgi:hypothetical protein